MENYVVDILTYIFNYDILFFEVKELKKSVVRIIAIGVGTLLFLLFFGAEILNQYSLWQEFGTLKYSSFFAMLFERSVGAFVLSIIIGIIPIIFGEIIIFINKK